MQIHLSSARRRLLQMHFESGVGHIGGNLSCLDLLLVLFHRHLFTEDRFVLSKGHSAGALYIALWSAGRLDERLLSSFHGEDTLLAGHPCAGWHPDILFATGSLGHGLSLAAGLAHAKRLRHQLGSVFCLVSDGELNEGSTWEAIHYIGHHRLNNLTLLIDLNGLQGFGETHQTMRLGNLLARLEMAGFTSVEIDGHNPAEITRAMSPSVAGPKAVIARTVKGKGVSFMENRMEWHYLPLTKALYAQALAELPIPHQPARYDDPIAEPGNPMGEGEHARDLR